MAVAPIRRPRRLAVISWISSCPQRAAVPVPLHRRRVQCAGRRRRRARLVRAWISLVLALLTAAGLVVVARRALRRGRPWPRRWRTVSAPAGAARPTPSCPPAAPAPAVGEDPVLPVDVRATRRRARGEPPLRRRRHEQPARRLPPSFPSDRGADAHLPPRRRVQVGPQEPRGAPAHPSPGQPGLDLHQRQLPPLPDAGGRLPRTPRRRQAGHRLGPHPRARARRRPRHHLPGGQLGRCSPHRDGRADANDPTFQPGFEAVDTSITAGIGLYGYYGALGGRAAADDAARLRRTGRTTVVRRPRRERHLHPRRRRPRPRRELRACPPTRSCTPSSPAPSTPSTSSTRSASRRSSTPSRPSRPGSAVNTHRQHQSATTPMRFSLRSAGPRPCRPIRPTRDEHSPAGPPSQHASEPRSIADLDRFAERRVGRRRAGRSARCSISRSMASRPSWKCDQPS